MSAEPADRTTVHVTAITPRAEKAIGRLPRQHQLLIAGELEQGVPFARCKPVEALVRFKMRRFDVSDTLRVTLRPLNGGMVVCHAGTHPDADRFADLYNGELPSHLVPIQESTVMKNLNKIRPNVAPMSAAPKPVDPPAPVPATPPTQAAGGADLLAVAIGQFAEKLMEDKKRQFGADIDAMGDLVRAQAEENLQAQVRNLSGAQEGQRRTFQQTADALRAAQTDLRDEFGKLRDRLASEIGELRSAVDKSQAAKVAEAADAVRERGGLLARIDALRAADEEREREREKVTESLLAVLADIDRRLGEHATAASGHGEVIKRLEQRVQRVEGQMPQLCAVLEERQSALAARVERIESDLSGLGDRLDALRAAVERLDCEPAPAPRSVFAKLLARLGLS